MKVMIGAVTLGPGVKIQRGVKIGGVDFWQIIDRELEVENQSGLHVLTGYYGERIAT